MSREAWHVPFGIGTLDVSGAFDNVSHPRLIHNLKKRRIDPQVVKWVESFLKNRKTTVRLPEVTSEPQDTEDARGRLPESPKFYYPKLYLQALFPYNDSLTVH